VGRTNLVGAILRHVLEDPSTLQTSMETEIRTIIGRMGTLIAPRKKPEPKPQEKQMTVKALVAACTPLICRDPVAFLKAAACSVVLFKQEDGGQPRVKVLAPEKRSENAKKLAKVFEGAAGTSPRSSTPKAGALSPGPGAGRAGGRAEALTPPPVPGGENPRKRSRTSGAGGASKSKSPVRSKSKSASSPKRTKKDGAGAGGAIELNGSPANHVTSLLVTAVISDDSDQLLSLCDLLHVLADMVRVRGREGGGGTTSRGGSERRQRLASDQRHHLKRASERLTRPHLCSLAPMLPRTARHSHILICARFARRPQVLALPTTAAAIHRYKGGAGGMLANLQHALKGGVPPPKTAVSWLLHKVRSDCAASLLTSLTMFSFRCSRRRGRWTWPTWTRRTTRPSRSASRRRRRGSR
jgi:hypothetical protein